MSGFWVIGLNTVARSMISKCVRCKHLRGRFQQQKMADLPRNRMTEEAPFTFCSIDVWAFCGEKWLQRNEAVWGFLHLSF